PDRRVSIQWSVYRPWYGGFPFGKNKRRHPGNRTTAFRTRELCFLLRRRYVAIQATSYPQRWVKMGTNTTARRPAVARPVRHELGSRTVQAGVAQQCFCERSSGIAVSRRSRVPTME